MFSIAVRLLVLAAVSQLAACAAMSELFSPREQREGVSGSLVDYLYPKGEVPPKQAQDIPRLDLPIRVGIAFVPQRSGSSVISEATKLDLLQSVKAAFTDRKYIAHIEVIPETYLRSSNGFEGMSQVARLYSVDVMALVSYDQVATTADTKKSIMYWTIVGAYVVKGTKNNIHTFVDTAVFDVPTRKLLFRAPGSDVQTMSSTFIENEMKVQEGRSTSFAAAMTNMTGNLQAELATFEKRLKTEPQVAEVRWSDRTPSGGGGGSMSPAFLLVLMILLLVGRNAYSPTRNDFFTRRCLRAGIHCREYIL